MAGLDNMMEHAENAQKVKVAKEDSAEKQRQKDFYAKLRARTACRTANGCSIRLKGN